jgi:cell division transport system permease protein
MMERAFRAALAEFRLHLLSVFSVAVAFVCLSATLLVAFNIDSVRARWAETGRASVYLAQGTDPKTIQTVRKALLAAEGVTRVDFVSSEQARAEVMGATEDEALAGLPDEAFPASLEVTLRDEAAAARVEKLKSQLEALPAVEAVETYRAWGERLDRLLRGGAKAAVLLLLVVLAAVVSVVGSTMRMALSRRRAEVEVLKMVGATDGYVRGPFVIEGAAQGGLGALFAVGLMGVLFLIVRDSFDGTLGTLLGASPQFLPLAACVGLVLLGAAIGALSAYASLRRLIGSYAV